MSHREGKKGSSVSQVEDVWSILQQQRTTAAASSTNEDSKEQAGHHQTIVLLGTSGSGKTSLFSCYTTKKGEPLKDVRPSIALDYNNIRKGKNVAHVWEAGGDFTDIELLSVPVTAQSMLSTAILVVCDLSKPKNIIPFLCSTLEAVRKLISNCSSELNTMEDPNLHRHRERIRADYDNHPDISLLRSTEIPIIIVANKFDMLQTQGYELDLRRSLFQAMRFIAHYYGAALVTTTATDIQSRDDIVKMMGRLCFPPNAAGGVSLGLGEEKGNGITGLLPRRCDANPQKPVYITRGADSYYEILMGDYKPANREMQMCPSEKEMELYISKKKISKECWVNLIAHMRRVFGEADPIPTLHLPGTEYTEDDSEKLLPEEDIDELQKIKMVELHRHLQEQRRKADLYAKLNRA